MRACMRACARVCVHACVWLRVHESSLYHCYSVSLLASVHAPFRVYVQVAVCLVDRKVAVSSVTVLSTKSTAVACCVGQCLLWQFYAQRAQLWRDALASV